MKKKRSNKFAIIRTLEQSANVIRLIGLVGIGFYLAIELLNIVTDNLYAINNGTFNILSIGFWKIILLILCVIIEAALYFSKYYLEDLKERNDFQLDNFEDSVKFSRHRKRPAGQMDENGEMVLNIFLKRGSDEPMEDLNNLIGLEEVKEEVRKLQAILQYEEKSQSKTGNVCRHYAFLGNPGTGKTTVARIFAGLLYQNGRIKYNQYLECTGNDLTGEYAGQTKNKVNAIYKRARGGVLFIDEAYALCKNDSGLSEEVISQLLVHMESDPNTVVIFAGYLNEMQRFLELNPGLASRVSRQINFQDYNCHELIQIFQRFAKEKNLKLSQEAGDLLYSVFEEKKRLILTEPNHFFSNGRFARNCYDYVYQQHAVNSCELNPNDPAFSYITYNDVNDIYSSLLSLS